MHLLEVENTSLSSLSRSYSPINGVNLRLNIQFKYLKTFERKKPKTIGTQNVEEKESYTDLRLN